MDRAAFADKSRPEVVQHPIDLQKNAPESLGVLCVIGCVGIILPESNWVRDFVGHLVDAHGDAELARALHEIGVEFGYRPRNERYLAN